MYPGKVAVMAQFMPTFVEQLSTDDGTEIQFTNDEDDLEEEQTKEGLDHKLCFIFIVDRSGSMGYPELRIKMAREALQLFMQSLPTGSQFKIISFGSDFRAMKIDGKTTIDYNDSTRKEAISQVENFSSDYGGTEIYTPIKDAFDNTIVDKDTQKRVFLLTDGQVGNSDEVVELISNHCDKDDSTKVFSFGISSGCDQDLIKRTAAAGQGSESIVMDEDMPLLKEKVIKSLRRAGAPAMQGCNFDFGNNMSAGF